MMSLLDFFRAKPRASADTAKERLQILLAHDRAGRVGQDFIPMMQKDILAVIARYIDIDEEKVSVQVENSGSMSTLEVNIELPANAGDAGSGQRRRRVS